MGYFFHLVDGVSRRKTSESQMLIHRPTGAVRSSLGTSTVHMSSNGYVRPPSPHKQQK